MKVLLLNDTSKWYHFGCTATSSALISGIKKLGHSVTCLPITETYKIKSAPNTKEGFINNQNYRKFIQDNENLIKLIKEHDAVVFNGEGTLHGINPAPLSLLYLAYISKKELGKHIEILNHSAYPQHDTTIGATQEAAIYQLVYNTIDFASIREPISFNTMKKLEITTAESFDCMPLYIRDNYIRSNIKHPNEILIAGSATWLQINIPSSERGNIEDYTRGLSGFNQYLQQMTTKGYNIKFLYGADSNPAKDDREFVEYMEKNFATNWEFYEAKSLDDWLKTIEEASLLVSGRFHHTIAAASLGTHFIALNSNTPKIDGLLQLLGHKEVIKYNDVEIYNKLITITNSILPSSPEHSYDLKGSNQLDFLCNKAERNFDGLKKNDLGIVSLTGAALIEYIPIIQYFSKEIVSPLLSLDTFFLYDYTNIFPTNNAFWVTMHFSLTFLGYSLLTISNPKINIASKVISSVTVSSGYALKLVIHEKYKEIAENRINDELVSSSDESSFSLLNGCYKEVAFSTITSLFLSLPTSLIFTPNNLIFSSISTSSTIISSSMQCASSNGYIVNPDNSTSGFILPYIVDIIVGYSLISSISFGTLYSLPEVSIGINKIFSILGIIALSDQVSKSVIEILPNSIFENIDILCGLGHKNHNFDL